MAKKYNCSYCGSPMVYKGTKRLPTGMLGAALGGLDGILSGTPEISLYECEKCGKLDFFRYRRTKGDKA